MDTTIEDAIETLTALRDEHPERAEALILAIEALQAERERFEAEVTKAEEMLGVLLEGANARERADAPDRANARERADTRRLQRDLAPPVRQAGPAHRGPG